MKDQNMWKIRTCDKSEHAKNSHMWKIEMCEKLFADSYAYFFSQQKLNTQYAVFISLSTILVLKENYPNQILAWIISYYINVAQLTDW